MLRLPRVSIVYIVPRHVLNWRWWKTFIRSYPVAHCWRSYQSAKQPIHDLLFWTVPDGVQRQGNHTTYVKVLLEDYGGEKIKKKDLAGAISQVQKAMEDREQWRKDVKSLCK